MMDENVIPDTFYLSGYDMRSYRKWKKRRGEFMYHFVYDLTPKINQCRMTHVTDTLEHLYKQLTFFSVKNISIRPSYTDISHINNYIKDEIKYQWNIIENIIWC